jgi:hypothetical protein
MTIRFSPDAPKGASDDNYDFNAANAAQTIPQSLFVDDRFNPEPGKPIRLLKFPISQTAMMQKVDVLPMGPGLAFTKVSQHSSPTRSFLCLRMQGERCPFCEMHAGRRDDQWYWNTFRAKQRALFNMIPLDANGQPMKLNSNDPSPVYLFDTPASEKGPLTFWQLLTAQMNSPDPADADLKRFAAWDGGHTMKLTLVKDTFNGKDYMKVTAVAFVPRTLTYNRATWEPLLYTSKGTNMLKYLPVEEVEAMAQQMLASRKESLETGYTPQRPHAVDKPGFFAGNAVDEPAAYAEAVPF